MEPWSDSPIHPSFTIKFFIDTNILVYLVDNTFQSLTDFIDLAKDLRFVELVSSKYVIFEFTGVRKREHYLRKVVSESKLSIKGEINFSSLLNYQNKFEAPEVSFDNIINKIKSDVETELLDISTNYKINYNYSTLHDDQLHPTSQICLSTKLANQDCLVLVSGVMPQPGMANGDLQILTNDGDFVRFYAEADANLDSLFKGYKVQKPQILAINSVFPGLNLKQEINKINLENHLVTAILKLIVEKNKNNYLGKTIQPDSQSFPKDVIAFKINLNMPVPENFYITIISKSLKFIYTTKKKIGKLQHNGSEVNKGHIFTDDSKNKVAFKAIDIDSATGKDLAIDQTIIAQLREEGNLVFIHPDSQ